MKRYIRANMSIKWEDYLPQDVFDRLQGCYNRKSDLPILRDALWQWYQDCGKAAKGWSKTDAAIEALEWMEMNGQDYIADMTVDEYDKFING